MRRVASGREQTRDRRRRGRSRGGRSRGGRPGLGPRRWVPDLGAVGLLLLVASSPAAAQSGAAAGREREATVRVIETYDPASGERDRRPVPYLHPMEIRAIQEALVRAGRLGALTGQLDGPTREALRRFQRERELEPCGCPSYETLLALGIEPRVVQILVGSARETGRMAAAPGAGGGTDIPEVRVVYGTPPRRPTGAPGPAAGGPGAGAPGPEGFGGPTGATGRMEDGRFRFDDRHLLFPVFIGSQFFPPKLKPVPSEPAARRGLPLGRRPVFEPPGGISTRAPPRRQGGGSRPPRR